MIRRATLTDVKGIARVHVDSWRTTYQGIVSDEYLKNLSYDEREQLWQTVIPETNVFVAVNESGEIVGFASGGKERSGEYPLYEGELSALYLLEAYQGQGLGKELVEAVKQSLQIDGIQTMLVFVLKDNPAKYFYESLGGALVDEVEIEIGEKSLKELVYGWNA